MLQIDYHAILPELIATGTMLLVLVVDLFLPKRFKIWNPILTLGGIIAATVALATLIGDDRSTFNGTFVIDNYAVLFKFLFLGATGLTVLLSKDYVEENAETSQGEFYFLLLAALVGMLVMPSARDLLVLFIALETISIPGFVMAGFRKTKNEAGEGALKFFLIGVLSTAIMLFGMSLIYGATQTTNLAAIAERLAFVPAKGEALVAASILMIVAGFAFKVSAVPFHFWAPDAYEGSPVPVAAFLSVASKAAGFAGLLQVCFLAFADKSEIWAPGFAILSVATMTLGNVVALSQTNVVRLLAYSSIAQAGYIMLPFAIVANVGPDVAQGAFAAALTYILIYSVMNLGAFAVVVVVGRNSGHDLSDYDGLAKRHPGLALSMMFFLLSLAGMIPTAGFWAKFFVFRSALEADAVWIAVVMVVNTIIALYYYVQLGARMFLRTSTDERPLRIGLSLAVAIAIMAGAVVLLTVNPDLFHEFSPRSTLIAL
jgi:NADH-quinone oxidoreductase subunit N